VAPLGGDFVANIGTIQAAAAQFPADGTGNLPKANREFAGYEQGNPRTGGRIATPMPGPSSGWRAVQGWPGREGMTAIASANPRWFSLPGR
jgi:hypothetical protein